MKIAEGIQKFWDWFVENEERIRAVIHGNELDREYVVSHMDEGVLALGRFKWEMGEKDDGFFLTISPNGDRDLLKISTEIMESGPAMEGWQFNNGSPPDPDNMVFSLYDEMMDIREVDAKAWLCATQKLPDESVHILVETSNTAHLDEATRATAAEMAVIKVIGEKARIQRIGQVKAVSSFEDETRKNAKPLLEIATFI